MPEKQAQEIRERLDRLAGIWDLAGPGRPVTLLKQAFEKRASETNVQLADSDFAIAQEHAGATVRRLPMHDEASLRKSATSLYRGRARYPYAWRKQAARRILKRAEETSVRLKADSEEYLNKAAGYGYSTPAQVSDGLYDRAVTLGTYQQQHDSAASELCKFAETVRDMEMTPALLDKLAAFVDELDRRTRLHVKYASGLLTPEEFLFAVTEKSASEYLEGYVTFTTGHTYSKDELAKAGADLFAAALGDDVEELLFDPESKRMDIEKASQVLPTLPRGDAESLVDALHAAGIRPVEKHAGLDKEAGVSYDAAMDLSSWKDINFTSSVVKPRVITRADEIQGQLSPPAYVL